jgi:16S rRNA processing protein RimM
MTSNDTRQSSKPQFLILARVMRPHGIRGDLSVQVVTDFPERMSHLDMVYVGPDPEEPRRLKPHHVTSVRRAKKDQWLLHIDSIDSREDADTLRSQYICVSLADAVPLEDDEVYLYQVIGLQVQTTDGENLGRVTDIIETGANDVYVIKGEAYGEILLPAIAGVIRDISVETGVMTVQLLAGLLPDR